jgi:Heparinase II/III-like protein/Heparinase II/III N-terminus
LTRAPLPQRSAARALAWPLIATVIAGSLVLAFVAMNRTPEACVPPASDAIGADVDRADATCDPSVTGTPPQIGETLAPSATPAPSQAATDPRLELWLADRSIRFASEAEWRVPRDPTWRENPFGNLTWQTRYQSLEWLAPAAQGFRDGNRSLGEDVRRYVLDWIAANPPERPAARRAWSDGAVWRRTNALIRYRDVLEAVASPDEVRTVLASLQAHGERLASYLEDPRFVAHNHNLFHALALHNLAVEVPELARSEQWRADAVDRIGTLAPEMLNPVDGVSTEQASAYHGTALNGFATALEVLSDRGESLPEETSDLLARATEFAALLPAPAGYLPAIGDTGYGASDRSIAEALDRLAALGVRSDIAEYVESRGRRGQRPPDAAFFTGEGYAIFRPSYGEEGPWEDDLHAVVDMGPTRRFHGHHDAMNVLLSVDGEQVLVDPGGPFDYGSDGRRELVTPAGHNTIIVDGKNGPRGGAEISWTSDTPEFSGISGSLTESFGTQQRTVLLLKPGTLIILDHVVPRDGDRHRYQLRYHLAPEADVNLRGRRASVRVGGAQARLSFADTTPGDARIGLAEGWVTPRLRQREPAPVIRYADAAREACFATVVETRRSDDAPALRLADDAGGCRLDLRVGDEAWDVSVAGASVSVDRR